MGMFDTAFVPCPRCGSLLSIQSKAGPCNFNSYMLGGIPANIAGDIDGKHLRCPACKSQIGIRVQVVVTPYVVDKRRTEGNEDDES